MDVDGWDYATSSRGEPYILKEAKKLKVTVLALAKLEKAMLRIANGTSTPGEAGPVRNGVWELRVQADNRWYRLLYGKVSADRTALLLLAKKQNQLDDSSIVLAEDRLREQKARLDG